jgi:hypothetical protein
VPRVSRVCDSHGFNPLTLLRHPRLLPLAGLIVFISLAVLALRLSHPTLFSLPSFDKASTAGSAPSIDHAGESDKTGEVVASGDIYIEGAYNELSSVSTRDKKYFTIDFGAWEAINPNVIPHPSLADTWIIVAQKQRSDLKNSVFFSELVCVTPSSRMAPLPALILRYSCL